MKIKDSLCESSLEIYDPYSQEITILKHKIVNQPTDRERFIEDSLLIEELNLNDDQTDKVSYILSSGVEGFICNEMIFSNKKNLNNSFTD